MTTIDRKQLELSALEILRRDYEKDVDQLNAALATNKAGHAGLEPSLPPVLFTGDPFQLLPDTCIAVIGINPRFQPPGPKQRGGAIEYPDLIRCVSSIRSGHADGFDRYVAHRASFFDDESKMFYGTYFTGLGKMIARNWLKASDIGSVREVFRNHVFKTDILPWFSMNTLAIDQSKFINCDHEAWVLYRRFLFRMIGFLKPRWIQCNGKLSGDALAKALGIILEEKRFIVDGKEQILRVGWTGRQSHDGAEILTSTPILVHAFMSSVRVNHAAYSEKVAEIWEEWLGWEGARLRL